MFGKSVYYRDFCDAIVCVFAYKCLSYQLRELLQFGLSQIVKVTEEKLEKEYIKNYNSDRHLLEK